jgi:dienelactone hydrolase
MRHRISMLAIVGVAIATTCVPALGGPPPDPNHPALGVGLVPGYDDPTPAHSFEGTAWQSQPVWVTSSATGARLYATLFAPNPLPSSPVPGVVIASASGQSDQAEYQWSARELADHGYIALTVDPQGQGYSETFEPGSGTPVGANTCSQTPSVDTPSPCAGVPWQSVWNYTDAIESGITYLLSPGMPWASSLDTTEIGATGHSMTARAVSWLQYADTRIKAIVAWDNLASNLEGDDGSPSGGPPISDTDGLESPTSSHPVTPRVPALGEASEYGGPAHAGGAVNLDNPSITPNPEVKKTAYNVWRAAGIPSMEVVFSGADHGAWADGPRAERNLATWQPMAANLEYYTRAWFDRWLKGDTTATSRLLATTINGASQSAVISSIYKSAAFLDGHDCPDLSTC